MMCMALSRRLKVLCAHIFHHDAVLAINFICIHFALTMVQVEHDIQNILIECSVIVLCNTVIS